MWPVPSIRNDVTSYWSQALSAKSIQGTLEDAPRPLTHQISSHSHPRTNARRATSGVVRYRRKFSFGHSLYLLVMPKGGRYWQYRYRFRGRAKLLSLGCYPDVSMESARARHHAARQLLALGVDLASRRKALRQVSAKQA